MIPSTFSLCGYVRFFTSLTNFVALFCTFSNSCICFFRDGAQTGVHYSNRGLISDLYNIGKLFLLRVVKVRRINPTLLLAFAMIAFT